MMGYTFLTTGDLSWSGVFAWAKKLITDLNKFNPTGTVVFSGSVLPFAGAAAPTGWLICDGTTYGRALYPSLFLAIGYAYGGAGDNFSVPDMRDRALMGAGTLVALGATAGVTEVTLTETELPTHTHVVDDGGHTHEFTSPAHNHTLHDPQHHHAGGVTGTSTGTAGAATNTTIGNTADALTGITLEAATVTGENSVEATGITLRETGDGMTFSILNPVFGINYIIKV